jgi:peptidoglycan/xylan/chitin deacetylase (PgdA/CDA1 family)
MKGLAKTMLSLSAGPLNALLARVSVSSRHVLHVLTYHRVDEVEARPDLSPVTLSASPEGFAAQMQLLRDEFHVVSLDEVRAAAAGDACLPRRAVLLTFDDAYRDFAEHAWPVLRALKLPATLFVPTAYVSDSRRIFWWDRLHQIVSGAPRGDRIETPLGSVLLASDADIPAVRAKLSRKIARLPHREALERLEQMAADWNIESGPRAVLNWDELKMLRSEGLTLAPHTRTHPLLNRIPFQDARDEICDSVRELAVQVGSSCPVFAYPGGVFQKDHEKILRDEGFELGFTTQRGANDLRRSQQLALWRINVGRRTTVQLLQMQLSLPPQVYNWMSAHL